MQLLNKKNLAVTFAASQEESRYTLKAILVTDKETVATDGHVLARVSNPTDVKAENFPMVPGFTPNGFTKALISVDAAKEIEKAIPKSKTLPILAHAAISSETVEGQQRVQVAVTDLDTPKVFSVRPVEGQFPTWDSYLWANGEAVMDVAFDAALLKKVADAAVKFSDKYGPKPIRLRFYKKGSAMRFDLVNDDGQEMNGLVMPLRSDIQPTFKP